MDMLGYFWENRVLGKNKQKLSCMKKVRDVSQQLIIHASS